MANTTAELERMKAQGQAVKQDATPVPKKKDNGIQIYIPGEGVQSMDEYSKKTADKANDNNVLKLDTAEKEGNVEAAKSAVEAGVKANKAANTEPSDYLKEKAAEYGVPLDADEKKSSGKSAPAKTGSDLGGRTTEEWYLWMLEQGYSPDEIADMYEKEGYSRTGAKFKAAAEKYKNWKKAEGVEGGPYEAVDSMTPAQQETLWDKIKGKLTNKDLEAYAKENGISYGQALRYTLASMFKAVANGQEPITGKKPFSDEETLTPMQRRYRVTSGKVDEEAAKTKGQEKMLADKDTRKTAAEFEGSIEGRKEGAQEVGSITYKNENGQEFVNFANLQASIKDVSDAQALKTLEKQLGLERSSAMALQKFLSQLSINQNYAMGLNQIRLETDKVKQLGDYVKEHPDAVENYKQYGQEMRKSGMTEAEIASQWVDTVTKPVAAVVDAATPL